MQNEKISLWKSLKRTINNIFTTVDTVMCSVNNVAEAANIESEVLKDHALFHRERHNQEMAMERKEWEDEVQKLLAIH
jgi:hypothetical protein